MSLFNKMDDVKYHVGRFFLPVLFLIVGIILLRMGLVAKMEILDNGDFVPVKQNAMFKYASLFFLLASAVWFLYLFNVIKTAVGYIVIAVMAVSGGWLIYNDYSTVQTTVTYNANWDQRDLDIKARILDVKQAQLAYKAMNKGYTDSMDELIEFVKKGKKMKILKEGQIPERVLEREESDYIYGDDNRPLDNFMTEIEATKLSRSPIAAADLDGFKRDTNFVSVMEAIFLDEKYVINRDKIGAKFDFNADSLRFVPYSKILTSLTTDSTLVGEIKVQTLLIEMTHPMSVNDEEPFIYAIGSLEKNHLRESWK